MRQVPVVTVPVPFIGWLWPHNVSYADVDRLMGRERWHLISQKRLFDHCVIVAVVWTHFPPVADPLRSSCGVVG